MTLQLQSANLEVDIPFDYAQMRADGELIKNYEQQNFMEIEFIKPAEWKHWALFLVVQYHDINSTSKAMKYECVYEANPFLPKRPSKARLFQHKALTLYPLMHPDWNKYPPTKEEVLVITAMTALVVNHNYNVINKIKKYPERCPKVGTV